MPGQTSTSTGQELDPLITLLVQTDDEATLRRLLDTDPARVCDADGSAQFFVIEDGSVTRVHPPIRPDS